MIVAGMGGEGGEGGFSVMNKGSDVFGAGGAKLFKLTMGFRLLKEIRVGRWNGRGCGES